MILLTVLSLLGSNHPASEICPCNIQSDETQMIIEHMLKIALEKPMLLGLTAPQIGVDQRIILVSVNETCEHPQMQVLINPEILWQSEEHTLSQEEGFSSPVPRANQVWVRFYDREGSCLTQEYEGRAAHIVQRAIDVLDKDIASDQTHAKLSD